MSTYRLYDRGKLVGEFTAQQIKKKIGCCGQTICKIRTDRKSLGRPLDDRVPGKASQDEQMEGILGERMGKRNKKVERQRT